MAVFLQLYQGKIGPESNHDKWFARPVRQGSISIKDLAERIQANTTFKQGEVHGILIELVEQIKSALQAGQTVCLDGLGRFHLKVECEPAERPEEFRVDRNVKAVKCQFVPTSHRTDDGTRVQNLSDGVQVRLWKP